MSDLKLVGQYVARAAQNAMPILVEDADLPSITDYPEAEAAIHLVVTQSAPLQSQRVWAAAFAALTAVLAVPEIQAMLGPWAPVVTATVSALLAGWSKFSDPRPVR